MEKSEKLQAAYAQTFETEGGKDLIRWMTETAASRRKDAGKQEPTSAWGELRFADGIEEVLDRINTLRRPPTQTKR